jgi:hypothetical protein
MKITWNLAKLVLTYLKSCLTNMLSMSIQLLYNKSSNIQDTEKIQIENDKKEQMMRFSNDI